MHTFHIEKQIAQWRKDFEQNRAVSKESLHELESHLRNQFGRLVFCH